MKLCFVYLLTGFLIISYPKATIDPFWLQIVDELSVFDRYHWGRLYYNKIIEYITRNDMKKWYENSDKTALMKWNFYGCPWIFQVSFKILKYILLVCLISNNHLIFGADMDL